MTKLAKKATLATVCAAGGNAVYLLLDLSQAAAMAAALDKDSYSRNVPRKKNGRFLRGHALPNPDESVWRRVNTRGDDMEFFHFMGLSHESFNDLAELCKSELLDKPVKPMNGKTRYGKPRPCDIK
eukprot:scaffold105289_cov71-Attheya_sp.AAC.2